jgi:site-specific recombinase XerD
LIEPAVAFLHEHSIQRAHTDDTLRTYAEILYDWFETLEQNDIPWESANAVDLVAYRNRMMAQPSPTPAARTGRRPSTIAFAACSGSTRGQFGRNG